MSFAQPPDMYDTRTDRRSRSWDACMVGTRNEVLRQAVDMAGACEGGGLQPCGRHCAPENYIRRIRRLIDRVEDKLPYGGWQPCLCVAHDHPIVTDIRSPGVKVSRLNHGTDPSVQTRTFRLSIWRPTSASSDATSMNCRHGAGSRSTACCFSETAEPRHIHGQYRYRPATQHFMGDTSGLAKNGTLRAPERADVRREHLHRPQGWRVGHPVRGGILLRRERG